MTTAPIAPVGTDPLVIRQAYSTFPSGVTAIAALIDGVPVGMAASSFTTVSLDPPLVSVCVQDTSTTWPVLARAARLGVTVLGAGHGVACRQLASRSGDRFAGLDWTATPDGAVVLTDAPAAMECSVHDVVTAGDHDIVILRIHALTADADVDPLVFHASRFRSLAV
jgi:flavin reductase (DIM6/NTAB) family NADH-FMN oxidoreductase RutF